MWCVSSNCSQTDHCTWCPEATGNHKGDMEKKHSKACCRLVDDLLKIKMKLKSSIYEKNVRGEAGVHVDMKQTYAADTKS